jgi:ubiquinone/menaquinone biosynthesis C-methylase UbiE
MTVSFKHTVHRYKGAMAANYETKRSRQIRWKQENDIVASMLQGSRGSVLDCPVGAGRYLQLYKDLKLKCTGIDSSDEMLFLAYKKKLPGKLKLGNAAALPFKDKSFDQAVCVRFLDLIDEETMRQVVRELCRVARSMIICTIRFGTSYVPKSNTATHDERKFKALIKGCGWKIAEARPIFTKGWFVLKLESQETAR